MDTAAWREKSACLAALKKAHEAPARALPLPDYRAISDYFLREVPRMNDRTRGDVVATLTSLINPFLTGYLRELFCTTTNVVPEMTHEGAILVIDLSIKEHAEAGIAVSVPALAANPPALRHRIIRHVVASEFGESLSRAQTLEVARLVTDWHGQGPIDLPGCRAHRAGARIVFAAR